MGEKGQTIIEALVALGASVAIIAVVVIAVTSSLNNTLYNKNQNLATQYAQQGMEIVRQIRDNNWAALKDLGGNPAKYCLDAGQKTLQHPSDDKDLSSSGCAKQSQGLNPTPSNLPPFAREVDINSSSADCQTTGLRVTVIVSWTDGKCPTSPYSDVYCHKVALSSCFSDVVNTNTLPTP
ncbi:hypothetical protein M1615_03475 [Patescibacteria group bacterium]|nr:hypothetical protein [Patescibacteria group bacterium]MCL5010328.1 hypothetical protein [Patescibacteria group bacterium]